jgi:hypothetical protein
LEEAGSLGPVLATFEGIANLIFQLNRLPEIEVLREGNRITDQGQIRRADERTVSLVRVDILEIVRSA